MCQGTIIYTPCYTHPAEEYRYRLVAAGAEIYADFIAKLSDYLVGVRDIAFLHTAGVVVDHCSVAKYPYKATSNTRGLASKPAVFL